MSVCPLIQIIKTRKICGNWSIRHFVVFENILLNTWSLSVRVRRPLLPDSLDMADLICYVVLWFFHCIIILSLSKTKIIESEVRLQITLALNKYWYTSLRSTIWSSSKLQRFKIWSRTKSKNFFFGKIGQI